MQGHGGAEEVTVAAEALGTVFAEAALVVARVEEAAVVVAVASGCTYNSSSRSSRTMVGQRAQPKVFPVLILAEKLSGFCLIYFELAATVSP